MPWLRFKPDFKRMALLGHQDSRFRGNDGGGGAEVTKSVQSAPNLAKHTLISGGRDGGIPPHPLPPEPPRRLALGFRRQLVRVVV